MAPDYSFLYTLLETPSVSGQEELLQRKALAFGRPFAAAQAVDPIGNVIQTVAAREEKPLTVLLLAHADEIGFVVSYIDEKGLLHLNKVGGVSPVLYLGTPMQVWHAGQMIPGVVASSRSLRKKQEITVEDLLIDIGAGSAEAASKLVAVGDPVCADAPVRLLQDDNLSARALDDKCGVWVILEAARRAAEAGSRCRILAVTTAQEETTGSGAYLAAARLQADCAIVVDVTSSSDCPGTQHGANGDIALGRGPALCRGGLVNRRLNERLTQLAREKDIPLQFEVAPAETYTDGDTVMHTAQGIPMALLSIPNRYMHACVEMVNLRDLDHCAALIAAFLTTAEPDFDFVPFRP